MPDVAVARILALGHELKQLGGSVEWPVHVGVHQLSGGVDGFALFRGAGEANSVEALESDAERIEPLVAARATVNRAVLSKALASRLSRQRLRRHHHQVGRWGRRRVAQ